MSAKTEGTGIDDTQYCWSIKEVMTLSVQEPSKIVIDGLEVSNS